MHAVDLDRADALARSIADASDPDLARVFGLARQPAPSARPCRSPESSGSRCAGSPRDRSQAPCSRCSPRTPPRPPRERAAPAATPIRHSRSASSSRARIHEATRLEASLGASLTDVLRELNGGRPPPGTARGPDSSQVTGLGHLTDATAPMFTAHQPPSGDPGGRAAVRGPGPRERPPPHRGPPTLDAILRTVAATVTLVESRSKGESTGRRGHHPRPREPSRLVPLCPAWVNCC